jgi:hypothetical protein
MNQGMMAMMRGQGGPNPGDMQKMMAGRMGDMQKMMANRMGGQAGGPAGAGDNPAGAGGAGAGGGADNGPADLHTPEGAVMAFLSALKAKDLDRLREATADRAPLEASAKNRDFFKKIYEMELSDADLDDLAKKMDGFQIAGFNPARSTGRLDIVVRKTGERGETISRKVTVRREKKGWGVLDIEGPREFKQLGNYGQRKR